MNLYEKLNFLKRESKASLLLQDPLSEANLNVIHNAAEIDEKTQKYNFKKMTETTDFKGSCHFNNNIATTTKKKKKTAKKTPKAKNTQKSYEKKSRIGSISKPVDIITPNLQKIDTYNNFKSLQKENLMFYEDSSENSLCKTSSRKPRNACRVDGNPQCKSVDLSKNIENLNISPSKYIEDVEQGLKIFP